MNRMLVALSLAIIGLLSPWQFGDAPAVEAAVGYAVTRTTAQPARVAAGQPTTIEARVLARATGVMTVEATVRAQRGQLVWQHTWPNQSLTRNESRTLTTAWTVPSTVATGRYRLAVRMLNPNGREAAKPRTSTLQITGASGNAPAAPGVSIPAAPPAPTPAPTYPFAITGSSSFAANIRAGLEQMQSVSPQDYAIVVGALTEIREGPQNYAWGGSRSVQISASSAAYSRAYAGAIVLHEAVHVRNWFANDFPVFGCDGEAKSLRAQAAYLRTANDPGLASWIDGLIGNWC